MTHFQDVSSDILTLHKYEWRKADGYNQGNTRLRAKFYGMSMAEYMKYLWNNPQNGQSPYKMYEGVLVPEGKDEQGNIIYRYNPDVSL